jgi:tRNA threonylcarbamoyladenosine biosynthesis protein TsaE
MNFKTNSAKETTALGERFFACLKGGDVVLFEGALGGGKTTFIKGLLNASGYKGRVLSPTFTISRVYKAGKLSFCHSDLYRLEGEELFDWGIDDFLYEANTVCLVEWGEKLENSLNKYIKIYFEYLKKENTRKITFSTKGYAKDKLSCL